MDNPFYNFNQSHNPSQEGLYNVLSRMSAIDEAKASQAVPTLAPTIKRSPISWMWAAGFSMAGAMAAVVLMITVNGGDSSSMSSNNNNNMAATGQNMASKKVARNTTSIDEALATVSSIEGVTDPNKF